MKKKYIALLLLCFVLIFSLSACRADFVGNKIKVGNKYTLSFSVLNTEEKESMNLKKGQKLGVALELETGKVSVRIGKAGEPEIYKGTDLFESAQFDLIVPQNGRYHICVSGKDARGKIEFKVTENEMV